MPKLCQIIPKPPRKSNNLNLHNFHIQVEGARLDKKTRIGMILGTGSNAAFLERAERVHHWEGERHNEKNVIIDIEWGAFGDKGTIDFIRTEYDKEVDNGSLLKNSFT